MDYESCYYQLLLSSIFLGVIKLETYLSILGKTLFLKFKNQCEGESIRPLVSTLCCYLHGEYNHVVFNPVPSFQNFSRRFQTLLWAQNRPFLTSHISSGETPKILKFITNNTLFQSNIELKLQLWYSINSEVLIMRRNAFSVEMEVCVIFNISKTIETNDSSKKPICYSWYGL
jgi:hypothetical protein